MPGHRPTHARWLAGLTALLLLLLLACGSLHAAEPADATAIRQVMAQQVAAWNRGDIDGFMQAYRPSADTTFIGSTISHGYEKIRSSYHAHYANRAQMGHLSFSQIEVRLLAEPSMPARYAVVTGRFHLDRDEHGAVTQDDGVFSLLWIKTAEGWKIMLDHTS